MKNSKIIIVSAIILLCGKIYAQDTTTFNLTNLYKDLLMVTEGKLLSLENLEQKMNQNDEMLFSILSEIDLGLAKAVKDRLETQAVIAKNKQKMELSKAILSGKLEGLDSESILDSVLGSVLVSE